MVAGASGARYWDLVLRLRPAKRLAAVVLPASRNQDAGGFGFTLGLTILPVYLLADGRPQIFHGLSLLLMMVVFIDTLPHLRRERDLLLIAALFSVYAGLVNIIWYSRLYDGHCCGQRPIFSIALVCFFWWL